MAQVHPSNITGQKKEQPASQAFTTVKLIAWLILLQSRSLILHNTFFLFLQLLDELFNLQFAAAEF